MIRLARACRSVGVGIPGWKGIRTRAFVNDIDKFLDDKMPCEASSKVTPSSMVAPVLISHGVLGSLLSLPVLAEAMTREIGVVGSAAGDWDLIETTMPLSLGFVFSGLVSAVFGKPIANLGPRKALIGSAICVGSGMALSALAVHTHSLPLLGVSVGVCVGAGAGLCFASPIQTLMSWFPDNKGICGGISASAIGLGAVLSREGLGHYLQVSGSLPRYLGPSDAFNIIGEGKNLSIAGESNSIVEVVGGHVASSLPPFQEGLYVVGSGGSTGVVSALATMSMLSFSALTVSSIMIRTPPKKYSEDNSNLFSSPLLSTLTDCERHGKEEVKSDDNEKDLDIFSAVKLRNFHVLGGMLACTVTSGVGLIALSSAIISEEYAKNFPELVTTTFLDNQLLGLSAAAIFGAGFWSTISDFIGCRKSLILMHFICSPAIFALPMCTSLAIENESTLPVLLSVGASAIAVTSLGGVMAIMPAYCAELFGAKNVTATAGGIMGYFALAATCGPYLCVKLHQLAEDKALSELLLKVSPDIFEQKFNFSIGEAHELVQKGTIKLSEIYDIMPAGTMDPVPHLYDSTIYSFAGLITLSAISNALIIEPTPTGVANAKFSPHARLPEKIKRVTNPSGKIFIDRRKTNRKRK